MNGAQQVLAGAAEKIRNNPGRFVAADLADLRMQRKCFFRSEKTFSIHPWQSRHAWRRLGLALADGGTVSPFLPCQPLAFSALHRPAARLQSLIERISVEPRCNPIVFFGRDRIADAQIGIRGYLSTAPLHCHPHMQAMLSVWANVQCSGYLYYVPPISPYGTSNPIYFRCLLSAAELKARSCNLAVTRCIRSQSPGTVDTALVAKLAVLSKTT